MPDLNMLLTDDFLTFAWRAALVACLLLLVMFLALGAWWYKDRQKW